MKQKLQNLFFLFLLVTIGAKAQGPVITAAGVNPYIGESIKGQGTAYTKANYPQSGGANVVWDYSNLVDSGAVGVFNLISPKGLPYSDSFPTANIAIQSDTTSIGYWQASSNSWGEVGNYFYNSGSNFSINITPPIQNYIVYPMTYKKLYTDSIIDQSYINNAGSWYPYTGVQYDTLYADGYGTLKLPHGVTYNNVLRVFSGVGYGVVDGYSGGSYWFFANGTHWPLLVLGSNSTYNNGVLTIDSWNATYYQGAALPIEISSFSASWQNKMPYLQWEAANTENTKQFNIQRSADGHTFSTVGQVGVSGGGAYHFEDNYVPTSTVYYRLQQVDKNGQTFYSSTAHLTINDSRFTIYPNPTKDNVTINGNHIASVQVIDNIGRVVKVVSLKDATNPTLSVNGLPAGVYHLQVQTTDGAVSGVGMVKE